MEECKHEWSMDYDEWHCDDNCYYCHDIPIKVEKWWRFCRLCHRLESFILEGGKWEHKEEREGRPC